MREKWYWIKAHHEYTIFFVAIFVLVLMWIADRYFSVTGVIPPGGLAKIAFAIVQTSIIGGASWIWMNVVPKLKELIDPDTFNDDKYIRELTSWQKALIRLGYTFLAFLFYALLFLGGILSAKQF